MSIIAFILIGLVAGLIARAILPGSQSMGLVVTTLLGMAGSLVGGMIGSIFHRGQDMFSLQPAGLLMSVVGAIIVVGLATRFGGRRRIST